MKAQIIKLKCEECHKEFRTSYKTNLKKYCSKECAKKADYRKRNERYKLKKLKEGEYLQKEKLLTLFENLLETNPKLRERLYNQINTLDENKENKRVFAETWEENIKETELNQFLNQDNYKNSKNQLCYKDKNGKEKINFNIDYSGLITKEKTILNLQKSIPFREYIKLLIRNYTNERFLEIENKLYEFKKKKFIKN